MADRQDIDALLIGALYGELDDSERARLEAHLASHPQDRSALEGLRSTRELLREADLPVSLAVAEPSPAITAMLLQEAARRAPAKAAGGGFFAFLAGLLKPFAASPALSAAAALVLVGGAAGLLYSRGTFDTAEPTVGGDTVAELDTLQRNEAAGAPGAGTAPSAPPAVGAGAGAGAGEGTIDDYRVALDDGETTGTGSRGLSDLGAANEAADKGDVLALESERKSKRAPSGRTGAKGSTAAFPQAEPATAAALESTARGGGARPGYLAIEGENRPTVLSADGTRADSATAEGQYRLAHPDRPAVADKAAVKKAAPPPPPSVTAGGAPAPQQVTRDQGKAGAKAYDPSKAAALDTWARDQHARMVKLVNAGKCTEAGPIGYEIARKHPDYYQANVANDRAVRACRSYIDRARRAKAEDAKSRAAAPRNNAPDSQFEAEADSAK